MQWGICGCRRQLSQLEEGDVGTLHPVYHVTCQPWIAFMAKLGECYLTRQSLTNDSDRDKLNIMCISLSLLKGCPSIQQCTAEIASHFLLPSVLAEVVSLVSSLASDTSVKAFERTR